MNRTGQVLSGFSGAQSQSSDVLGAPAYGRGHAAYPH